jgi:hypothetical protein
MEIPNTMIHVELLEQVHTLEDGFVKFATGGVFGDASYEDLRRLVIANPRFKALAPECLKINRPS